MNASVSCVTIDRIGWQPCVVELTDQVTVGGKVLQYFLYLTSELKAPNDIHVDTKCLKLCGVKRGKPAFLNAALKTSRTRAALDQNSRQTPAAKKHSLSSRTSSDRSFGEKRVIVAE